MKIVVFDLDETLGYFVQLGIFWDVLQQCLKESLTQEDFHSLLDLYPEFLRPNILTLLKYLMHKKKSKCCHKMLIYTNNQGPSFWCKQLISYFDKKLNFPLFDQIINAFKINGEVIEFCRTSHDKSWNDLMKCTKIPSHSQICFLDDNYFPEMANDNVYYINVKPYTHDLPWEEMIRRFSNSSLQNKIFPEVSKEDKLAIGKRMMEWFQSYYFWIVPKTMEETNIDKIVSKQILIHLQEFFDQPSVSSPKKPNNSSKSMKRGRGRRNRTRKQYS
jgi:hypothetical protein